MESENIEMNVERGLNIRYLYSVRMISVEKGRAMEHTTYRLGVHCPTLKSFMSLKNMSDQHFTFRRAVGGWK